jgi:hypothetical protein
VLNQYSGVEKMLKEARKGAVLTDYGAKASGLIAIAPVGSSSYKKKVA